MKYYNMITTFLWSLIPIYKHSHIKIAVNLDMERDLPVSADYVLVNTFRVLLVFVVCVKTFKASVVIFMMFEIKIHNHIAVCVDLKATSLITQYCVDSFSSHYFYIFVKNSSSRFTFFINFFFSFTVYFTD